MIRSDCPIASSDDAYTWSEAVLRTSRPVGWQSTGCLLAALLEIARAVLAQLQTHEIDSLTELNAGLDSEKDLTREAAATPDS